MKDVQKEKDLRNIPLKNVGIEDLKWPIVVSDKKNGNQHTIADISVSVDLPHHTRGTHMSRFVECLQGLDVINYKNLEIILDELKEKLEAETSNLNMKFTYFINKKAPVSEIEAPISMECSIKAKKSENLDLKLKVKVPVHTLCPCSKEISENGAHNQRAIITMEVDANKKIWIEDLVYIAEKSSSVPIYSLLKRVDEKWVTEKAYENPRFVEDVAREVAVRLEKNDMINWYKVQVKSIESIHNHNAFATVEKGW
ncbi:GTP cyclohydrolase FolE2 [Clostridium oceanicum]|uniref:GTP cyclohydrolase FolE2 n=1 Tax=Clostridium oceanicum TaxID=1543 RepID=A0ABN1JH22_9CLOT